MVLGILRRDGISSAVYERPDLSKRASEHCTLGRGSGRNDTASLSIITKPPTDAETLHRNPLGLYVHGLHWSKDLNATGASQ